MEKLKNNLKQKGSLELRMRLPRGAVKNIADQIGVSWIWAFKVISGKESGDPRIISLALEYAKVEEEKRVRFSNLIAQNKKDLDCINT